MQRIKIIYYFNLEIKFSQRMELNTKLFLKILWKKLTLVFKEFDLMEIGVMEEMMVLEGIQVSIIKFTHHLNQKFMNQKLQKK